MIGLLFLAINEQEKNFVFGLSRPPRLRSERVPTQHLAANSSGNYSLSVKDLLRTRHMNDNVVSCTTFGLYTAVAGYLTYRSLRPPTPPKVDEASSRIIDTISFHHSYTLLAAYRSGLLALILLQALLISSYPATLSIIGPIRVSNLNPTLLTWNWQSAAILGIIDVCAAIRLYAMGELGHNFTFELREPDRLNTGGLYAYVQHPSYSTGIVVFGTSASWFVRGDGVLGVILPLLGSWGEWGLRTQWLWNYVVSAIIWAAICLGARRRIVDEERMLKKAFGKEWEEWHARTARLIPGLF